MSRPKKGLTPLNAPWGTACKHPGWLSEVGVHSLGKGGYTDSTGVRSDSKIRERGRGGEYFNLLIQTLSNH